MASSRGRPGGHTSRPSLSELYSGRFPHGSEDGATAGRTPASAKVATYHPPAGARIPRSISRPLGVDSQNASPALGANVKSAGADSTRLVDWSTDDGVDDCLAEKAKQTGFGIHPRFHGDNGNMAGRWTNAM